jgi:hypothetical protein
MSILKSLPVIIEGCKKLTSYSICFCPDRQVMTIAIWIVGVDINGCSEQKKRQHIPLTFRIALDADEWSF